MISSLREGVRMREGLLIAKEVQQHFLPKNPPSITGLDIAGTAHFSDETGGDFYDFIDCDAPDCQLMTVVVGDVSGHGIGAALLMSAGRALTRQGAISADSAAQSVATANKHLARDIGDTGRFMTLFYVILDPVKRIAAWVNAGHQPPLIYNPATDDFSELKGEDIPLGVEESWQFHENYMNLPEPGQIILIGTDGIWEAHNQTGEMYGNKRLQQVIRNNSYKSAQEIIQAVVASVHEFSDMATQEDDVTLVVIKGIA